MNYYLLLDVKELRKMFMGNIEEWHGHTVLCPDVAMLKEIFS